jgi:hypothetical protein
MKFAPAALAATALTIAGCGLPSSPVFQTSSTVTPSSASPSVPPSPLPIDALRADFAEFSAAISAEVGVVMVTGQSAISFGTWTSGPAWSTIKVPLAIAALRRAPRQAEALVFPAITQSDNTAAEGLWSLLGNPADAARAVEAVLRDGGDTATIVQSQRIRPEFTAFGQTDWPMEAQAQFASRLPCIAQNDPVVGDMRHIAPDQAWGLADDATAAKGGWGPDSGGRYLVRQLATIITAAGTIGVALAALPHDGTFQSGVAAVNQLANWVRAHTNSLVASPC